MDKTVEIKGFVRQVDLDKHFDIVPISEKLASNFLILIERREPGFDSRTVATMTAIMVTPKSDKLMDWIRKFGSQPVNPKHHGESIKNLVDHHMGSGVFSKKESIEMAAQKAIWYRFMKFYADYRKWKRKQIASGAVV